MIESQDTVSSGSLFSVTIQPSTIGDLLYPAPRLLIVVLVILPSAKGEDARFRPLPARAEGAKYRSVARRGRLRVYADARSDHLGGHVRARRQSVDGLASEPHTLGARGLADVRHGALQGVQVDAHVDGQLSKASDRDGRSRFALQDGDVYGG